jgi:3-isopropylmalate/(R)-2-methylmalate dehydratase small subunit
VSGAGARKIDVVEGHAVPLRGHDIDTDRIMPARFLKSVSFEGLEAHVFEDDRAQLARDGRVHPLDDQRFAGASILLVNRNFGCGSSREHAPQGLMRRGIEAVVGESFSEIFLGNSLALGIPCFGVAPTDAEWLLDLVERDPQTPVRTSVASATVEAGGRTIQATLPPAVKSALLTGAWDATGMLLQDYEQVADAARRLPYVDAFRV